MRDTSIIILSIIAAIAIIMAHYYATRPPKVVYIPTPAPLPVSTTVGTGTLVPQNNVDALARHFY